MVCPPNPYRRKGKCPSTPTDCPCVRGAEGLISTSCCAGTYTPGCSTCNSVLLSSGKFSFKPQLLAASALGGIDWAFDLDYLADNDVDSIVGKFFNFNSNVRLTEEGGDVDLQTGWNTRESFSGNGGDRFDAAAENNSRAELRRMGNGEFALTSSAGVVSHYSGFDSSTPGRLKSVTDRYGTQQTYIWSRQGTLDQLLSVTDSYGRTVNYSYYGGSQGNRLKTITDFLGRRLDFQYDSQGHLVAIITPSIVEAAEGNEFPGGTAYVFQYDENNPRDERRDDLLRIWYPNEATPFIDTSTRTIDVQDVYNNATPRYVMEYGQDPTDTALWGRVTREQVGNPSDGVGGCYEYQYTEDPDDLPENIVNPDDPVCLRCIVTDRNGNQNVYDFNSEDMPVHSEEMRTRSKIDIPPFSGSSGFSGYTNWNRFNSHNQSTLTIFPEGNSVEYEYEDGTVPGINRLYNKRAGLMLRETRKVDNPLKNDPINPIPARRDGPSNGQTQLTTRYFYEPIFNQQTAMIEPRGNPISNPTYFTPQNGGTTPTDADRSRYATITLYDYQKNQTATVTGDADLQSELDLSATEIQALIDFVDNQMKATDGSGGLPDGFEMDLGDINGDGTGNGASSGLPAANILGHQVKTRQPPVRLIGTSSVTTQVREELYTFNNRGQMTTQTDGEGNLTVNVYYPLSDPEGDGKFVQPGLGSKQYGRVKEVHVDADPSQHATLYLPEGDTIQRQESTSTAPDTTIRRMAGSSVGIRSGIGMGGICTNT